MKKLVLFASENFVHCRLCQVRLYILGHEVESLQMHPTTVGCIPSH